MIPISDFVTQLTALGVKLWVEDAELKLRAPKGTLSPDIVSQLKARKADILSFLSGQNKLRERQPITPAERRGPDWDGRLPLSFAQQRMWFFDQLDQTGSGANIPLALNTRGLLDSAVFEASVNAMVQRHETLRTRFCADDGRPVQLLVSPAMFSLQVIDLTALTGDERMSVRDTLIQAETHTGFQLDQWPLFRMIHLRLSDCEGVMMLKMHHIISDGWSLGIFIQELCAGYEARLQDRSAALPPLPIQYADFAAWQQSILNEEVREKELDWWREQISDIPNLALPTDRPRPALQTTHGDLVRFRFEKDLAQALDHLAGEHGATLFMVLHAALSALFSRLCGQDRFGIGAAVANRTRRECEPLIGYFVNTLVLRVNTSGDPGFTDLIQRARDTALAAFDHQDIPFEQVVDALQPERDLSRTPFFQVMLLLQNAGGSGGQLPGLSMDPLDLDITHPLFDLNFAFEQDDEGLGGAVEFNTDLFDRETVVGWCDILQNLLRGAITNPRQPLSTLPLLDAQTQKQLLAWSTNPGSVPVHATMHACFEAQALANGTMPALAFQDEVFSYATLNRRANQLARGLRAHGIGRGSLVALNMDRGVWPVLCQLAIFKAGAAFLPLNTEDPDERVQGILQDAGADLVLSDQSITETMTPVINLNETDLTGGQSENNLNEDIGSHDVAYVIYTSGSTGKPKGVVIPHGALVNFAEAAADAYNLKTKERALQFANLHFDTAIEEIYTTVARCGLLIPRTRDMIRSTRHFLNECGRLNITILNLPTAYWHQITADLASGEANMPPCIRVVIVGGERMLPEMVIAWQKAVGAYPELKNGYGPTETTVAVTAWTPTLTQPPRFESGHTPIGGPYRNVQAYVCDRFGQLSPVGVPGELWIGGMSVAQGYLGQPGLTARQFVPDPFSNTPGSRAYRTGDLSRRLPAGNLECIGRADQQVKVRGYRIEMGEVESALGELDAVALAAVDVRGSRTDRQLIAWVQVVHGKQLDAATVRGQLAQHLPDYMIPAVIHCVTEPLPVTSTGKIDRATLAARYVDEPRPKSVGRLPQTPTEQLLADIFGEVLGLASGIDAETSFFELGGHSLLATQVIARIEKRLGCALPLQEIFTHATVARLAHRVESSLGIQVADRKPIPVFDRTDASVPLSFAQRRLWFLDQLEGASATYNMPTALRLRGAVDSLRLDQALRAIIQRHEVLRAAFPAVDDKAGHRFLPMDRFGLTVVDLSGLPQVDREVVAKKLRNLDVVTPFNLKTGPICRSLLLRHAADWADLLVNVHHIAFDGWSTSLMIRELVTLYGGGEPEPLPIQYADFAQWQIGRTEDLRDQLAWWEAHLEGAPTLLQLPTDRPRPPVRSERGAIFRFDMSLQQTQALNALARQSGSTLFMVLHAGFAALLSRYSLSDDLLIGTPIANRNRPELENLMGFFANMLVLRLDLGGDPTFAELLTRARDTALASYRRQDVPFEHIVDVVQPERNNSHTPLFQVVLVMQNTPEGELTLPGLRLEPLEQVHESSKFDLTMNVGEYQGRLAAVFEYSTDLYTEATMARMADQLICLLDAAAANPKVPVAQLPLLSSATRNRMLTALTAERQTFASDTTVARFRRQCKATPQNVAVRCEGKALTYQNLDTRADHLAAWLQKQGAGPEVLVGVSMERSVDLIITLLAVQRTGAGYLPLDPVYPASRIALILEDAGAPLLVTHRGLADDLPSHHATVIDLEQLTLPAKGLAAVSVDPLSTAYVIYTSGSTGKPKGVPVSHRNVCRLFDAADLHFDFDADDVWTLFHSYAFDFSVWEIWGALLYGGRLVIVPGWIARDTEAFYRLLVEEGVTVLNQTPGAFMQLSRIALAHKAEELSLRWVIFGGEALDLTALAPWFNHFGDTQPCLVNMYGITETTVHVTFRALDATDTKLAGSAIGAPLADLGLHVLDKLLEPLPIGVPGELCVAGSGLARGYLNRPGLTAQRFVPDPFAVEPGGRLYRSGDLARRMADGDLDYRGRIDHQVKLRGFRIELGEIRAVLLTVPGVRQVEVVIHDEGAKQLVAYVVGTADETVMRTQLREKLPEYMVPSLFMSLESFPLTAHGKLDRKRLPLPKSTNTAYVAPRNTEEAQLADIFATILERDQVGIHDNFFQLGGHSLLATRVIAGVRDRFHVDIPLRTLFEQPTVAAFTQSLAAAERSDRPPVLPIPRTQDLPLSFNQQRLWFLDQFEGADAIHNIPAALRLDGPFSVPAMEMALESITQRHEVLRTTYEGKDGQGFQVVHDDPSADLPLVDLSGLDAGMHRQVVTDLATQSARTHFDLNRGPVVLAAALRLGKTAHIMLHVTHHIATDGWSLGLLVGELEANYRAAVTLGRPAEHLPLPVQYADFAVWQRARMAAGDWQSQQAYWQHQLADAPALHGLATDRPRPAIQTYNGAHEAVTLDAHLTAGLKELAQTQGATLFMVLLAGFKVFLHRTTGREDHVVGTPIAGRNRKETENLIGFFVNTMALRTSTSGDPTFVALLTRVRSTALAAFANQDTPFERVVDAVQPERDLSHSALFQLMFQLQNLPGGNLDLPGLTTAQIGSFGAVSPFDMSLAFYEGTDGLTGTVEFNTDLFDTATIRHMIARLKRLYKGIVQAPNSRLSQLPLLDDEELARLQIWSQGPALPCLKTVPQRFRCQAEQTPKATALVHAGESLTYAQLLDRAYVIARHLAAQGAEPEQVVAICMDRSVDLIAAMLGCLIAGAAFLPLDPKAPVDRLHWMLNDAGAVALLVDSSFGSLFPNFGSIMTCLDTDKLRCGTPRLAHPESPAYMIYTSGSTGLPKGVVISHQAMSGFVEAAIGFCELTPEDRSMQFASISFDTAVLEIFPCLLSGATLYLRGENLQPDALMAACQESGITVLQPPTAYWHQFVQSLERGEAELPDCLRLFTCGGERMLAENLRRWQSVTEMRLLNTYGPTEICVIATFWETQPLPQGQEVPIGRPIAGATVYVTDPLLNPVPPGTPGELVIGGNGLARGYHMRPGLTAERFIPNPFTDQAGARLYRSGDRVRFLAHGDLAFLGRIDHQVKIRGFRVEPGEVETVLTGISAVHEAAVVAQPGRYSGVQLVAYLTGSITSAQAREQLAARLPEYMVPSFFHVLAVMPKTTSGKVDRRALRSLELTTTQRTIVVPQTPAERVLSDVWQGVLGVSEVSREDNFFALGGDSILALQVVSRARQAGYQINPQDLFRYQSLAKLASAAKEGTGVTAEQGLVTGPVLPTPIQERFFQLDWPERHHFNHAMLLAVHRRLDADLLRRAAELLQEHHDALRLRFDGSRGYLMQQCAAPFEWIRIAEGDPDVITQHATKIQTSLNLSEGPIWRLVYMQGSSAADDRLLVVIHHLAVDEVSWRVLMEDFETLLAALSQGERPKLPAKTSSFQSYAARLHPLAHSLSKEEIDFWLQQAPQAGITLPRDGFNPTGENRMGDAQVVRLTLSETMTHDVLHRVPNTWRVRVDDLLICALACVLSDVSGTDNVSLMLEGHGRHEKLGSDLDITRTVGWFTSMYPVKLSLPRGGEPGAALKAVKQQLRMVPGGGIGYGLLRYLADEAIRRRFKEAPQTEVTYNYLGRADGGGEEGGPFTGASESFGPEMSSKGDRGTVLEINAVTGGGQLKMHWRYNPAYHRENTIQEMVNRFQEQLGLLIAYCLQDSSQGLTPADFPLVALEQSWLDALQSNVETILPLSPMQQGMLFHELYEEPGSGTYFEQLRYTLRGDLDTASIQQAWFETVNRHQALRAAFHWDGVTHPVQVIAPAVTPLWVEEDWRNHAGPERLETWLANDRKQGFDLTNPCLMRFALLQTGPQKTIFVWSHHHLMLDGWSLPILLGEVFDAYQAKQKGEEPKRPEPPNWADYLAWLSEQKTEAAQSFWQQELSGYDEPTPLPGARETGFIESNAQQKQDLLLTEEASEELNLAARALQITPATLVQAAWSLLLARYSGRHDVVFGATVSGRPVSLSGVEEMVGLFINTLPVRVILDEEQTAADWMQRLHQAQGTREQFAYTPLTTIQTACELQSGASLFASIVVFENYPVESVIHEQEMDLEIEGVATFSQTHNPLTLIVSPGERLHLRLNYHTSRYTPEIAETLLHQVTYLLEQLAGKSSDLLARFDMVDATTRTKQLESWNQTGTNYPRRDLASMVADMAAAFPNRPALDFIPQEALVKEPGSFAAPPALESGEAGGFSKPLPCMTYGQLMVLADRLAFLLQSQGVGLETPVGLALSRSPEMIVSMLAILRAGGVYVPLDPEHPVDRLTFMAHDAGLGLLLTDDLQFQDLDCPVLNIGRVWSQLTHPIARPPRVRANNLAYMIYTSGSTGKPKGTMVPHHGVVRLVCETDYVRFAPEDRVGQTANGSFDVFTLEVWGALLNGACVVSVPTELVLVPARCLPWLLAKQVTVLQLTTALLNNFIQHDPGCFKHFRTVIFGGEAMDTDLIENVLAAGGPSQLINAYGPTESTTIAVARDMTHPSDGRCRIGKPIANTTAYVLNQLLEPVAFCVPGELFLGGDGLARGYLGRSSLTAERFVPHPFMSGERLYRTGDLVCRLPDGDIEFLGRIDQQVKIRGYRIELSEIRHVLAAHPGVQKAEVVSREVAGSKQLVAYLVGSATSDELQIFLSRLLPTYMVPATFVALESFPLTPNGKLDHRRLPAPGPAARERRTPRNAVEEELWHIWSHTLGTQDFGVTDNFFDLGGHSLTATRTVSQIRERLGRDILVRQLFQTPTIATLALALAQASHADLPPIVPIGDEASLPLSFAQQRLWFLDNLRPGNAAFNLFQAIWLHGPLDIMAFTASLNDMVARHDVLRTTFVAPDGIPFQDVAAYRQVPLLLIDLQGMCWTEADKKARDLANEEAQRAFDLQQGPLLYICLFRLSENHHLLFANQHHIISDGWSMGLLIEELTSGYSRHVTGKGMPPTPLPIQYSDYAHWQQENLVGERLDGQLAYWVTRLAGMPSLLNLPTDRPRPPVQSSAGARIFFLWDDVLTHAIRDLCRQRQTTPFIVLQTIFATLLHRYSHQDDFALGTPYANRGQVEVEALIGFFINTLVLRQDFSDGPSFEQLLSRAETDVPDAFAHADIPFERIVETVQTDRNTSHTPLFQAMFVLQNTPEGDSTLPGIQVRSLNHEHSTAQFDLSLELTEHADAIHASLQYNTDLFNEKTAQRMTDHFTNLARAMVVQPTIPVSQLPMLDEPEREALQCYWHGEQTKQLKDRTMADLFADRVAVTPNGIALLVDADGHPPKTMTYAELDHRADCLAAILHGQGAGPEKVVAVVAERTADWICSMLATWKAGAAYLPLDPALPAERLRLMLAEAKPVAVVSPTEITDLVPHGTIPVIHPNAGTEGLGPKASHANSIAYIIYTSGSTGRPKGVAVTHGGIGNLAMVHMDHFDVGPGSRILQFATGSFDASIWEVVMALLTGGTLVLADTSSLMPGPDLADLLSRRAITHVTLPPTALANTPQRTFPDLAVLVLAGETCPADLVTRFAPGRRFFNAYGPTETTVCATISRCEPEQGTPSIGRPLANFSALILDGGLQPVPFGVPGELYVAGTGLARGYLAQPPMTAARFVPNPFGQKPGDRLYRTGDLVRYLPDGQIDFLGRVDHQVKLRGFRVELDEVTTAILQSLDAAQAVTVVCGDRLVAYVTPVRTSENLAGELRTMLSENLPSYMVPSLFIILDELPLLPNGKVNRRALPPPDFSSLAQAHVAPRTDTEAQLATIWGDVLQLERVGVTDNFFEIGGYSLLATQVISRIRQHFDMEVPLASLFEDPTIARLAEVIEAVLLTRETQPLVDDDLESGDFDDLEEGEI